ncbi:MAG: SDR family oxidoreductase [Hyphomicrobiaceae bacterium]
MTHKDKRVIVTAAAGGIGRVTAGAFLEAGAKVFICDVDEAALAATLKAEPRLAGIPCDVAEEAAVDRLFEAALAHLGGLDILVNMAGIAGPTATVEDMDFAGWKRCLAVNLDSAFLCSRRAAPILRRQRSGSIVNMSSTAGLFGFPRRSPYASAKWAIRGFTRTLAEELGPDDINVNCICPGAVSGARIDGVIERDAKARGVPVETVRAEYTRQSSMKSFIAPEDIAATILFLTSPGGHRISGMEIAVDGHTETL